ncbi:MAG: GGDEF domain-containing protein, partial [Coriobacteriia bacterium]|nr:GGDEF domain-containing protein [Coriobacteriia bacterium]
MTQLASASPAARIRYVTDAGVLALVLYIIAIEFYARPVMEPTAGAVWEILVGAVYPVVAVLMLLGVVLNVSGLKVVKWRSWEKLIVIAMAVYLAGVGLWPSWYASAAAGSRNEARSVLDLLQLTGHYVLVMATVYRLTEQAEWFPRPLPPITLGRRRWLPLAFPLSALAATAVAALAAYGSRGQGGWSVIYGGIAVLLTGLVLLRSSLLALEHSTLFYKSITDPLTGVYNHRYFHDRLADEIHAAAQFGESISLVMIDVDDFSDFNSVNGHGEGDRLLASFAETLASMTSRTQAVSRIGGDEFAILLPATAAPEAHLFAQRLVDHLGIEIGDVPGSITISAGVATFPDHALTPEDLFRLADCAMLWAKERGKNRAVLYEQGRIPDKAGRDRVEHVQRQSRLSSVRALAAAVDARDSATQNHSRHVAALALGLGESIGIQGEHLR